MLSCLLNYVCAADISWTWHDSCCCYRRCHLVARHSIDFSCACSSRFARNNSVFVLKAGNIGIVGLLSTVFNSARIRAAKQQDIETELRQKIEAFIEHARAQFNKMARETLGSVSQISVRSALCVEVRKPKLFTE